MKRHHFAIKHDSILILKLEINELENESMRLVYENYDNLIQVDDIMQQVICG